MKQNWLKNIFKDKEFWLILAFNLVLIVTYYLGETSASLLVMLYFIQSLFIGLQYFVRLFALGFIYHKIDPKHNRFALPFFFLFHYGFFHIVYFVFLISIVVKLPGSVDPSSVKLFALALLGNTILSSISDIKKDLVEPKVPIVVMFQPYFRIVPMHLFIMLAFATDSISTLSNAFLLFIILKSIADVSMHIVVNKTYLESRPNASGGWI
jgi:hypothetical protein